MWRKEQERESGAEERQSHYQKHSSGTCYAPCTVLNTFRCIRLTTLGRRYYYDPPFLPPYTNTGPERLSNWLKGTQLANRRAGKGTCSCTPQSSEPRGHFPCACWPSRHLPPSATWARWKLPGSETSWHRQSTARRACVRMLRSLNPRREKGRGTGRGADWTGQGSGERKTWWGFHGPKEWPFIRKKGRRSGCRYLLRHTLETEVAHT